MIRFLDTEKEQTDKKHRGLVCVSVEAVTFSSQQMAGCSWIICMQEHAHTHSLRHTHCHTLTQRHTAGAGRIQREPSEDRRFPCSSVINGLIEAGAKMEGGPVCSPLMR